MLMKAVNSWNYIECDGVLAEDHVYSYNLHHTVPEVKSFTMQQV